jgi:sigma-E factor negative regulatory protein RseA
MDRISALMDGELDEREARLEIARLKQQQELREAWDAFHLIGDAVRGDCLLSAEFGQRLSERLQQEPTVLAPRRRAANRITAYALSAAASLSAVALVAWVAVSGNMGATQPELATVPAPIAFEPPQVASPAPSAAPLQPVSLPDDGRMSEYLIAHQGFSPSTALQGVVPYIRSVSVRQSEVTR